MYLKKKEQKNVNESLDTNTYFNERPVKTEQSTSAKKVTNEGFRINCLKHIVRKSPKNETFFIPVGDPPCKQKSSQT